MEYIVLGKKSIEPICFRPVENTFFNKPRGGLWASPLREGEYISAWHEWCSGENFTSGLSNDAVKFTLKENVKLYTIDTLEDLCKLVDKYPYEAVSFFKSLNFEEISIDYDGIFLTNEGQYNTRLSNPNLYGWDCESLLLFNVDCVYTSNYLRLAIV